MSPKTADIDAWFANARTWHDERARLRAILLDCDLTEQLKWAKPTYIHEGANIVLIMPLKETCTLLFMKGALLKDTKGLLVQPGENSQSQRQMRFTSVGEIGKLEKAIKGFVKQAVEVEKSGLKVAFKKSSDLVYPKEFQDRLDRNSALREAFLKLTPGRQRQYHLYFTGAKQSATREARVEKAIPLILDGMGMNDR
ncbi:YdeI/OmpD-associated family protein [Scleromatobacter humisilvae]|uniref:YdeI/OmpD-associated family protein n=1 Tax=Scleromatobacter humisilvae TaxID=2897159 RepID=A0A9X2C2N1_9BURK|nr:YdeI/OmpD-associated family protein [Scleromatobacter humisilvae]MCK9686225.1 YdeI/OmpD-associated family protein [Scleromatobacter humisilvae]